MSKKVFIFFGGLFLLNLSSQAVGRELIIDNTAGRAVYMARSIETANEIITEGYWDVAPGVKDYFDVPNEGKLSVRLNFDGDREAIELPGDERCGSPYEKFKSIVKKSGEPKVTLFLGDGNIDDGFATKKEGKDCKQLGGEMLKGFHETVACASGNAGEMCLPYKIKDTAMTSSMYVGACNETEIDFVYVAIKFFEANEWRSEGWWEVEKNKCRKVGPFPSDKPVYVVAMTGSDEAVSREWTPSGEKVKGCINSKEGFLYAEEANGTCVARSAIPESAPSPELATYGKLVEAGFHGVATYNIVP